MRRVGRGSSCSRNPLNVLRDPFPYPWPRLHRSDRLLDVLSTIVEQNADQLFGLRDVPSQDHSERSGSGPLFFQRGSAGRNRDRKDGSLRARRWDYARAGVSLQSPDRGGCAGRPIRVMIANSEQRTGNSEQRTGNREQRAPPVRCPPCAASRLTLGGGNSRRGGGRPRGSSFHPGSEAESPVRIQDR